MKELEYSYLKSEKTHDMVVFIKIEPQWLDKDIDFGIKENRFLIKVDNDSFQSPVIEASLLEKLNNQKVAVVFANENGDMLAEFNMSINKNKKNKP